MNLLSFYLRVIYAVQERDGWVDGVYLDSKKAFDKVLHRKLLWKMKNYGKIEGRLLEWMEDYLNDRDMNSNTRPEFILAESN